MGLITKVQSIPANSTSANLLAGEKDEFVEEPSAVTLYALASAVGLKVILIVGSEVVIDDQEIGVGTTLPKIPDDLVGQGGAFPGDRITLKAHNTTAGALTLFGRVDIDPV